MANEQLIDTVISPAANDQVAALNKMLSELDIQMIANIKTANNLNAITGNSKSFADYSKNATQSALALEKIQQAQNKTAQTTLALDTAQKKAAEAEQLRQQKALEQLAKKQQAQAIADAKEIAAAEAKAAKLQAIMDAANRKANTQFPATTTSANPVTEEPTAVMPAGVANTSDYEGGIRRTTQATQEQTAAMAQQAEVMAGLSTEYRANLELLLALKAEQAENAIELKELNVQDAVSGERAVFLTAEQLRLKTAIQQTNASLAQETKEMAAQSGSANELNAQLARLRGEYNALSTSERENVDIGGVMLVEIERLDLATKNLSDSTGIHNKHVGDYARGQAGAVDATGKTTKSFDLLEKVGSRVNSQFIRMIAHFALITVAFGAIEWLYNWIKELDIFTGRLDQATQKFNELNSAFESTDYKKAISNIDELTENIRLAKEGFLDKTKVLNEYNNVLGATMGYTDSLDKAEQEIVKHGEAYIKMTLYKAAAQLALSASAKASYEAAQTAAQSTKDAVGDVDMGTDLVTTPAQHKAALKKMQDDAVADKKKEADLQLKIFEDFQKKAAQIAKDNKFDFFDGTQDNGKGKGRKPRDDRKRILEEQLRAEKEILDATLAQEGISYQERFDAIDKFNKKSDELVRSGMKNKVVTTLEGNNLIMGIDNEALKIRKETDQKYIDWQRKMLEDLLNGNKEKMDEALDNLQNASDDQLTILERQFNQEEKLLDDKYSKGKLSKKKYDRAILTLNDQYNVERLAQIALAAQSELEIRQATLNKQVSELSKNGPVTDEDKEKLSRNLGIPQAQRKFDSANNAVNKAINKQDNNLAENPKEERNKAIREYAQAGNKVEQEGISAINDLRQKAFEAEIARLEKIGQQIDENASNEKELVNNSIASSATKARQIALIDKQTASAKKALLAEENKEKNKAAKADKEANIAKIISTGALAVINALTAPYPVNIVLEALTIGSVAIELAKAIAAPLPKYATGTDNYPGGLGIWGEAGMERATLPSGEVRFSNGAEVANFPRGTVITPHMELMRQIKPAEIQFVGGQEVGWREVLGQLKKMEPKQSRQKLVVNVDGSFDTYKRSYLRR